MNDDAIKKIDNLISVLSNSNIKNNSNEKTDTKLFSSNQISDNIDDLENTIIFKMKKKNNFKFLSFTIILLFITVLIIIFNLYNI